MGPLEEEIERLMRYRLSAIPAVQNAFLAGRSTPSREDLIAESVEDAVLEGLEIANALVNGLGEALRRLAQEFDERDAR